MATSELKQWAWHGLDRETGANVKGTTYAYTAEAASDQVAKQQKVVITSIKKRLWAAAKISESAFKPKGRDLVGLFRGLATSSAAGLSTLQSLDMARKSAAETGSSAKQLVDDLYARVLKGQTLPEALRRHEPSLGPVPAAVCEAGTKSGTLVPMLDGLADTMERNHEIKSKLRSAMMYPSVSLIVVFGVAAAGVLYVVPRYAQLLSQNASFTGADDSLPQPTAAMLGMSDALTTWWYVILPSLLIGLIAAGITLTRPSVRFLLSKLSLLIPRFGGLILMAYTVTMCQMFSLTLSSGVPLTRSSQLVAQAVPHRRIRQALTAASDAMISGRSISDALTTQTPPLDPYVAQLAAQSASATDPGKPWQLYADRLNVDVRRRIDTIQQLIQPMMTILLGAILLIVGLGITRPLLKVYDTL